MGALAVGGDADHVAAPVVRVALPVDEAALLERVEERDEAARVEPERVGDRRLRLAVALGEDRQDAVVVELVAGLLERAIAFAFTSMPRRASRKALLSESSCATRAIGREVTVSAAGIVVIDNHCSA